MPFDLKNTRAVYKRKVNKVFENLIGNVIEAYVDDMVIKNMKAKDHMANLQKYLMLPNRTG